MIRNRGSKKRDSILIIRDILRGCREPILKSRLLTKANLSYSNFKIYEKKLRDLGLIFCENNSYLISSKGRQTLALIEPILFLI